MTTMPKAQEISRKWYIIDAMRTVLSAGPLCRCRHLQRQAQG